MTETEEQAQLFIDLIKELKENGIVTIEFWKNRIKSNKKEEKEKPDENRDVP